MSAEWAAVGISTLAFLFSMFAAAVAHRASDKSNELQQRIVDIEEARHAEEQLRKKERELATRKAAVVAEFRDDQHYGEAMLVVHNRGLAEARDFRILLDEDELANHLFFSRMQPPPKPPATIAPDEEVVFRYLKSATDPVEVFVTLMWVDDSDIPGKSRRPLRIPR